tara:strand:- start:82464 stop:82649 length:186 start_codon:yes stop_codon:yes gene_type:complete
MIKRYYQYEHTNGAIITKVAYVVDTGGGPLEYFDSDFCKSWWMVEKNTETGEVKNVDPFAK